MSLKRKGPWAPVSPGLRSPYLQIGQKNTKNLLHSPKLQPDLLSLEMQSFRTCITGSQTSGNLVCLLLFVEIGPTEQSTWAHLCFIYEGPGGIGLASWHMGQCWDRQSFQAPESREGAQRLLQAQDTDGGMGGPAFPGPQVPHNSHLQGTPRACWNQACTSRGASLTLGLARDPVPLPADPLVLPSVCVWGAGGGVRVPDFLLEREARRVDRLPTQGAWSGCQGTVPRLELFL